MLLRLVIYWNLALLTMLDVILSLRSLMNRLKPKSIPQISRKNLPFVKVQDRKALYFVIYCICTD